MIHTATSRRISEAMGNTYSSRRSCATIPGTSVTNFAEHLATAKRSQYGLKPEEVIWIERYPEAKDRRKEDFDLVRLLGIDGESFCTPVWTRITEQAVDDLIAGVRKVEDLVPHRVSERPPRQMDRGR